MIGKEHLEKEHPRHMAAKLIVLALLIVLKEKHLPAMTWPQFIAILLVLTALKCWGYSKCCVKKKK